MIADNPQTNPVTPTTAVPIPLTDVGDAVVTWRGTERETHALLDAIERECTLACGEAGIITSQVICPAHAMLSSQRVLDHLLFVARNASWYVAREHSAT